MRAKTVRLSHEQYMALMASDWCRRTLTESPLAKMPPPCAVSMWRIYERHPVTECYVVEHAAPGLPPEEFAAFMAHIGAART